MFKYNVRFKKIFRNKFTKQNFLWISIKMGNKNSKSVFLKVFVFSFKQSYIFCKQKLKFLIEQIKIGELIKNIFKKGTLYI